MPKTGRNDPCPCGSGKKYKQCHLPIEEAAQAEQRRLRQAVDTLLPKLITAAREHPTAMPVACARFWNNKYTVEQLGELDDHEDRGADRFLTWFAFDYPLDDGKTLIEQLAIDPGELTLSDEETHLIKDWGSVRLRPYIIESVQKGQGMHLRDMLDATTYILEDHAASRRVQTADILIAHLVPAGGHHYIGGALAHLTADTHEKLLEFAQLHREAFTQEHPDATWDDLIRERSEILNHFVMALPVEEANPALLDNIILQTRLSLKLAGESLGIGRETQPDPDRRE